MLANTERIATEVKYLHRLAATKRGVGLIIGKPKEVETFTSKYLDVSTKSPHFSPSAVHIFFYKYVAGNKSTGLDS
jgi:hypothetical protein